MPWDSSGLVVGQGDDHAAAVRLPAFRVDLASVEVDDPLRDRETESRAAVARRACRVGAVETLEDARSVSIGDPGTFVEHLDGHAVVTTFGAYFHGPAAWRVAHRVLEQVRHDLMHTFGITVGSEVRGLDIDRHRDLRCVQLLLAHRV